MKDNSMNKKLLFLGDCNTQGIKDNYLNSYPEKLAKYLNIDIINAGYTMSTTYEMIELHKKYFSTDISAIFIQYGLVDSWKTFKYSPYVLYYLDSFFRKIARKIVKKYKKITKNMGMQNYFGTKYVVNKDIYIQNILQIINKSDVPIFLIQTVPNKESFRNKYIKYYNKLLDDIAINNNCHLIEIYDYFEDNLDRLICDDGTHINDEGYDYISNEILEYIKKENICF
jgi:lysophospholipase L1-like esterase